MKKLTLALLSAALLFAGSVHGTTPASEADSKDQGKKPWVVDIEKLTKENSKFRVAKWTGNLLQMTVMSIPVGGEIGLEVHPKNEQFIRVEEGKARVLIGPSKDDLSFRKEVEDDWAILIPAGLWHNVVNIGERPLKVYAIYAPAEHPAGTVHATAEEAAAAEHHHHH
ncbi:MAG: cupin domain-containing protein [Thermoanaerobaculia bacterium]|nr:cupin domain-containing protein [Thermoanaerobaculia bacterium]